MVRSRIASVLAAILIVALLAAGACHRDAGDRKVRQAFADASAKDAGTTAKEHQAPLQALTVAERYRVPRGRKGRQGKVEVAVVGATSPDAYDQGCRVWRGCSETVTPLPRCPTGTTALTVELVLASARAFNGELVSVRAPLAIGMFMTHAMACSSREKDKTCCNGVQGPILIGDESGSLGLDGFVCRGDNSMICCNAPAYGQMVVATGRMKPGLSYFGDPRSQWSLADPTLCFEGATDPSPPPASPPPGMVLVYQAPPPGKRSPVNTTAAASHKDDDPPPLTKLAVITGMNAVSQKVAACYATYREPGLAMVRVVIGKGGSITSATVNGRFAGTPTGTCVQAAVRTATFPPSGGLSTDYPFTLK